MKKVLTITFILMLLIVGCGKTVNKDTTTDTTTTAESITTDTLNADVEDIGSLDEDLDISELNDLDKQLAEIDW